MERLGLKGLKWHHCAIINFCTKKSTLCKTNTSLTCLWNICLVSSAAGAFDKELDRRVSIAKLRLNILSKHGPVKMISTKWTTDVECTTVTQQPAEELHTHEIWTSVIITVTITTRWSLAWVSEQGLTSHQTHYRSYRGRVFTGQMTPPTVSKHWRKTQD